jgi:hypothetical protein
MIQHKWALPPQSKFSVTSVAQSATQRAPAFLSVAVFCLSDRGVTELTLPATELKEETAYFVVHPKTAGLTDTRSY